MTKLLQNNDLAYQDTFVHDKTTWWKGYPEEFFKEGGGRGKFFSKGDPKTIKKCTPKP
jgi:hypothetical protein